MKKQTDTPLQEKCAWCRKKLINHHRLCDKCHSIKQKRLDIGRKRENIPNKSNSEEHNKKEVEKWSNH